MTGVVAFDQCTLCREFFSSNTSPDNPLTPLQGKCGHSFCRRCILARSRSLRFEQQAIGSFTATRSRHATSGEEIVLCPQCQRPSFSIQDLKPNQGLCDSIASMRELMASLSQVRSSTTTSNPAATIAAPTPSSPQAITMASILEPSTPSVTPQRSAIHTHTTADTISIASSMEDSAPTHSAPNTPILRRRSRTPLDLPTMSMLDSGTPTYVRRTRKERASTTKHTSNIDRGKFLWLAKAVLVLYVLFVAALFAFSKGILIPYTLRDILEQVETMEYLLQKARSHQRELEDALQQSLLLGQRQDDLLRQVMLQEQEWRTTQQQIEDYFSQVTQRIQESEKKLQDRLIRQQQQQMRSWRRVIKSFSSSMNSFAHLLQDHMAFVQYHEPTQQQSTNQTQLQSIDTANRLVEKLTGSLDGWMETLTDHVSAASLTHPAAPGPLFSPRNDSTRWQLSSIVQSVTDRLPDFSSKSTSRSNLSSAPNNVGNHFVPPVSQQNMTSISSMDSEPLTPPFQIGDHVVQRTRPLGRKRHGIVLDVHSLPSSCLLSKSNPQIPRYLVTIATPSKRWAGGHCTRQGRFLNKHEIVARALPSLPHSVSKRKYRQRMTYKLMDNALPITLDPNTETATANQSVEAVVQRIKFLFQLGQPTHTQKEMPVVFWDLQWLLRKSEWVTHWCKTGRITAKKQPFVIGATIGVGVMATVAPQVFLSPWMISLGPFILSSWFAKQVWITSSGQYLNDWYQRWLKENRK